MIPLAILLFLAGATLAWGFRVWILLPITLLAFLAAFTFQFALGMGFASSAGHAASAAVMPQLGYVFGLFARTLLAPARSSTLMQIIGRAPISTGPHRQPADRK